VPSTPTNFKLHYLNILSSHLLLRSISNPLFPFFHFTLTLFTPFDLLSNLPSHSFLSVSFVSASIYVPLKLTPPFGFVLYASLTHLFVSVSILPPHQCVQDLRTATLWARLKNYWTRLCLHWYKSDTPLCPLPPALLFPWNSPPIISLMKALASCPTLSFRPQEPLHGMENQVPQNHQSRSLIHFHLIPPLGRLHSNSSHQTGPSSISHDCAGRKNHPLLTSPCHKDERMTSQDNPLSGHSSVHSQYMMDCLAPL